MKLLLIPILIGSLKITAYRSVKEATDDSPFYTSTYTHVKAGGCAISRDLLCLACKKLHKRCQHPEVNKVLHYGDTLYINGHGFVTINDCMGEYTRVRIGKRKIKIPIINQVDIWVRTLKEEHKVFKQYKNGMTEVWKVGINVQSN